MSAPTKERKVIKHIYQPRGGCLEVFETQDEEVLISGPAGTGKSRACLEKILAMCLLTPNTRALILRKTLRSLASTALVTWRNYVAKEALSTGQVVYYGGSQQEAAQYRFKNGSTVTIGGLDNPTRIMSSEYDIVYIQEATEISLDDLELTNTRLRNWKISFQQLIMDCNPAGDKHWLKLRCNDGKCKLIESRHEDNPMLFDLHEDGTYTVTPKGAKYIAILDNLTGVRHKRLRLGLWVSAEGVIYEEFDPAIHVLPWFDEDGNPWTVPESWERYWTIDFGWSNAFVLKCYAIDPEYNTHYMYREIYHTQRLVEDHAKTILDIVAPYTVVREGYYNHMMREWIEPLVERVWIEPRPTAIICDHDAEGRKTFERHTGLGTQPAIKNVYEGINAHKLRLRVDPETGLAGFYIMADSLVERDPWLAERLLPTSTVEEYPAYVWKINTDGRVLDEPIKRDDHGMDTDRYHTMYHDYKGEARVTIMSD